MVELFWQRHIRGARDSAPHVIAVDFGRRTVTCNSRGVIPFAFENKGRETAASHDKVAQLLCNRAVLAVFVVARR